MTSFLPEPLTIISNDSPIVATAIHAGHFMSEDLCKLSGLTESERLYEEDPFTGEWTDIAPNQVIGKYSRFEYDLNRPLKKAVYSTPAEAWGLNVWNESLPDELYRRSIKYYKYAYEMLYDFYSKLEKRHGRFVVLDLHSYNHKRGGVKASDKTHPHFNIGTDSIDFSIWGNLINRFKIDLRKYSGFDIKTNVEENVIFRGGHHAQWVHRMFPRTGCVIAVEVKKFFMDECTGQLFPEIHKEVKNALATTLPNLRRQLKELSREEG